MNSRPNCKAYERGDQWFCDRCGVTWDLNDDDPPECRIDPVIETQLKFMKNNNDGRFSKTVIHKNIGRAAIDNIKKEFKK